MDIQTINDYVEKIAPPTIALLVTALVSVVIGIYLEKFKTRLVQLKYQLFFNPIATTIQNEFWGNIEVKYKGRQANHLSFVTVHLSNDSNIDLENVNIDIWVDQDSQILGHDGFYNDGGNSILLEQGYYSHFLDVIQRNQADIEQAQLDPQHITPTQLSNEIKWVLANKKFNLPILNRHTSIRLNLLTENFNGNVPQVRVSVLHKSVRLVTEEDKAAEDKRLGINMIVWGLIIFILGTWVVQRNYSEATIPIIIIGTLGVLYLLIGLVVYRLIKFIKYLLA
ncbi:hypothetical protein [Parapedobacter sp. 2B3]|uniref:hypothetical protein n=1 Tax=Parapedobacter sp. 2B3 TaxID=3342381 RepID=UPI0035B5973C